jgi:hypothetical protein
MNKKQESLYRYMNTRDKNCFKKTGGEEKSISKTFDELIRFGKVVVGGRFTCGAGKADSTFIYYVAWKEVVRKALALGFEIDIINRPNNMPSGTSTGGFWEENIYFLKNTPDWFVREKAEDFSA